MSGKSLLPMLDTAVFTDCENMDSTLREEPPKTVIFHEKLGRSCNIDDPEWNWSNARETTEFTATVNLGHPRVPNTKEKTWELTDVENWSLRNT